MTTPTFYPYNSNKKLTLSNFKTLYFYSNDRDDFLQKCLDTLTQYGTSMGSKLDNQLLDWYDSHDFPKLRKS